MTRSPVNHSNCTNMSLEDSSKIGVTSVAETASYSANSTDNNKEAGVVVEEGGVHEAIPFLLITRHIRGATRRALDNGRSIITAPRTSRERLFEALKSLPGIQLAEAL